jgi:hypothetical protein
VETQKSLDALWGNCELTEEDIKLVAEVLAKIGGNWYPERAQSASRTVNNRHREVARIIIAAVERAKAANQSATGEASAPDPSRNAQSHNGAEDGELYVGASVIYRPPGDKRTLACRIEKLEDGRAYVLPEHREIGWVSTHSLLPLKPTRDNATQSSRPSPPATLAGSTDAPPQVPEAVTFTPERPVKGAEGPAGVKYYFSSSGEWIAFSRSETDRYLFDRKGTWIGWFPWGDKEIADINGQYLGTVVYGDRIYRRPSSAPEKREAGFVMDPGTAGYVGYPGYAAHREPPRGFKDIDVTRIPVGRRSWLKSNDLPASRGDLSTFEVWMSKIGLGSVARAVEGLIRPERKF